jgi:hypothetical protein
MSALAFRYYAELDTLSAGREFDAILEAEIAKARLPRRRPRPQRPRTRS